MSGSFSGVIGGSMLGLPMEQLSVEWNFHDERRGIIIPGEWWPSDQSMSTKLDQIHIEVRRGVIIPW
jgi:hypothetical protein